VKHPVLLAAAWIVLALGACALAAEPPKPPGPRLTDAELFDALDLDLPELAAVKRAVALTNPTDCRKALAAYLRGRKRVTWWFDPHRPDRTGGFSKSAADAAAEGTVTVCSIRHTFPGGEIDWFFNSTGKGTPYPHDNEWQWQLGRMHFWPHLGAAYSATGDEEYARAFVRQLRSWVTHCPRPRKGSGNVANSAWRTIECGIRMNSTWPEAYHRFLASPSFTDDAIVLFLKSCLEQARHLRTHRRSGGNWLTMEMAGMFTVGCVFPELREARAFRADAIRALHTELARQFLPDGAQVELTPGYHNVALSNIMKLATLAERVGRADELPDDFVARSEKAYAYNLRLMTPTRSLPRFNDSWDCNVPRILEEAFRLFPQRRDFEWIATEGARGKPPAFASCALPWAGYVIMRSGWGRNANYLAFDAGPLGYGHVHQDKLNVAVWAHGREILFDGGGGSYEHSPWRQYAIDTFSHNTVLVGGKPQRRSRNTPAERISPKPIDTRWQTDADHDFAAGDYDGKYGDDRPATHTRRVLFVRPDLFVVADTLVPRTPGDTTYQARWHLKTTAVAHDEETGTVATTDKGLANLAVVPLLANGLGVQTVQARETPERLGWWVTRGAKRYVPATTVTHTWKGPETHHFLTLLVPMKKGEANPVKAARQTGPISAEVTLTDGRVLKVEADADPAGTVRLDETLRAGKPGRRVTGGATKR